MIQRMIVVATGFMLLTAISGRAEYYVDAATGTDINNPEIKLYMDAGFTTPAPVGTPLWFVADTSKNGVNTAPTFDDLQAIIAGTAEDKLIWQDAVAGQLPPLINPVGLFYRAGLGPIADTYGTADIWVYLWSDTSPGQVGDHFGVEKITIVPPPGGQIANPVWLIASSMSADAFTVIPEPSAMVLVGLGMLSLLILRRRHTI
jgi:hypothetical protein